MNEEQDYFKVGTREHPVVSNSSLSYIDPDGGSPQAFLDFFVEKQEAERSYHRTGHLIHKWQENREAFKVSEVEKPTEKLGLVADAIITQVKAGLLYEEDLVLVVARTLHYQDNWKDKTVIDSIVDKAGAYISEVVEAEENNLIYMTSRESNVIDCCVKAVEKHPVAKELLFMQDTDFSNKSVFKELEIYWTKVFKVGDREIPIRFKAKLDSLCIDFDNKTVTYTDPKSTSSGAYSFGKSFEAFKYYRQHAFYNWAIREWAKQMQVDITDFTFINYNIVIETNNLFQVAVYKIGPQWLFRGNNEFQKLVKRIVDHTANNQWNYSLEEMLGGLVLEVPYKEAS